MKLLAALADAASTPAPQWAPITSGGTVDDHMQFVYTWIYYTSVVIGVFVSFLLIYAFIRFRRRSDDEEPRQVHGSSKLEWTWTITPYIILMILFGISAVNMAYVVTLPSDVAAAAQSGPAHGPLEVTVVGEQFSWTYLYQDYVNTSGKKVQTTQDIYVPANTPVELHIVSTDVQFPDGTKGCVADPSSPVVQGLENHEKQKGTDPKLALANAIADQGCGVNHSFYIPALGGQINAIPGQVNYLWFDARPGDYYGQCTELCGKGHGDMLITVHSLSASDWLKWMQKEQAK